MADKIDIKSFNLKELTEFMIGLGEKSFRLWLVWYSSVPD